MNLEVNSVILKAGARYLVGLLLVFSVYMCLRGHNEPGGGFIGGLCGATGFILYAIAWGTDGARAALRVAPQTVAITGLGLALLAGLAASLSGDAFLTGLWLFVGAGEDGGHGLPLSTVLMFDIGVYLVVFGAILTMVFELEEVL